MSSVFSGSGARCAVHRLPGAELEITGAAFLGRCRALSCAGGKNHRHRLPLSWARFPPSWRPAAGRLLRDPRADPAQLRSSPAARGAELEITGAAFLGRCRALSCAGGKNHRHRLPPPWARFPPSWRPAARPAAGGSGAAAQLTGCQGAELEISGAAFLGRCRGCVSRPCSASAARAGFFSCVVSGS